MQHMPQVCEQPLPSTTLDTIQISSIIKINKGSVSHQSPAKLASPEPQYYFCSSTNIHRKIMTIIKKQTNLGKGGIKLKHRRKHSIATK